MSACFQGDRHIAVHSSSLFPGEVGGWDEHLPPFKGTHKRYAMMIPTCLSSTLWFKPISRLHQCLCHFQDMKIGFWPPMQRNLGGFESEYLDLPVNTVASSTGRDFSHDSSWRYLLLVVCGCYNGLILQGIMSSCPLRQLLFWGG